MTSDQIVRAVYQKKIGLKVWRPHTYINEDGTPTKFHMLAWELPKRAAHETTRVINELLGVPR